jgi:archaellum component FlaC
MAFETLESVENLQLQLIGQQKQIRERKAENDRLKYRLETLEQLVGARAQK